jgi:hypothetical protein
MVDAGLRTEALEPSTMPYQAELAMAVCAMIFHSLFPVWGIWVGPTGGEYIALQHETLAMHN